METETYCYWRYVWMGIYHHNPFFIISQPPPFVCVCFCSQTFIVCNPLYNTILHVQYDCGTSSGKFLRLVFFIQFSSFHRRFVLCAICTRHVAYINVILFPWMTIIYTALDLACCLTRWFPWTCTNTHTGTHAHTPINCISFPHKKGVCNAFRKYHLFEWLDSFNIFFCIRT